MQLLILDSPFYVFCLSSLVMLCLAASIHPKFEARRDRNVLMLDVGNLDRVNEDSFAGFVLAMYRSAGYKLIEIGFGRPLEEGFLLKSGKTKTVVTIRQTKDPISYHPVSKAQALKETWHADRAILVTNGMVPDTVRESAEKAGVDIVDRSELKVLASRAKYNAVLRGATNVHVS